MGPLHLSINGNPRSSAKLRPGQPQLYPMDAKNRGFTPPLSLIFLPSSRLSVSGRVQRAEVDDAITTTRSPMTGNAFEFKSAAVIRVRNRESIITPIQGSLPPARGVGGTRKSAVPCWSFSFDPCTEITFGHPLKLYRLESRSLADPVSPTISPSAAASAPPLNLFRSRAVYSPDAFAAGQARQRMALAARTR